MRSGRFAWIGGGRHLTSTTHVDNVVEGLLLGAERGRSGEAYFVTDGEPAAVPRLHHAGWWPRTGIEAPDDELPAPVAGVGGRGGRGAVVGAAAARRAARHPPGGVALVPGVHAGHLQGAAGAGLQAGDRARRGSALDGRSRASQAPPDSSSRRRRGSAPARRAPPARTSAPPASWAGPSDSENTMNASTTGDHRLQRGEDRRRRRAHAVQPREEQARWPRRWRSRRCRPASRSPWR